MSNRKITRLEKGIKILSDSKASQWCYVNTENEFDFMNTSFLIDENVEEYKVHNKSGEVEDYTNEAYMEEILVVLMNNGDLKFYNQNYDLVDSNNVIVKS